MPVRNEGNFYRNIILGLVLVVLVARVFFVASRQTFLGDLGSILAQTLMLCRPKSAKK